MDFYLTTCASTSLCFQITWFIVGNGLLESGEHSKNGLRTKISQYLRDLI